MLRSALDQAQINKLVTHYWRVKVVELTSSTQGDLTDQVRKKTAKVGDVLVANYQSAGRGRLDRSFEAQPNTALLFSFYIKPTRNREEWGWIPLIAGFSVAQRLHQFQASIKWPNDILINKKKTSGLIAEVVNDGLVIGIGINVGMERDQLPVSTATSLFLEGAKNITRSSLLCEILEEFEDIFLKWDQGSNEIQGKYAKLCSTLGKQVRIEYAGTRFYEGVAASISDLGELVLSDGTHVQAGDVIHLR